MLRNWQLTLWCKTSNKERIQLEMRKQSFVGKDFNKSYVEPGESSNCLLVLYNTVQILNILWVCVIITERKQYITKRLLLKYYSSYLSSSDTFYDILSDFAQIHGEPNGPTRSMDPRFKTGPCSNLTSSHVTRENTVGCVTNKTHGLVNTYMHKRHLLTAS